MWHPISLDELNLLIAQQLVECSTETRRLFEASSVTPHKWSLSPWGDAGGGFWVVAIINRSVLWYNDIEDGFNTSTFINSGTIEHYWCNQDTLHSSLLGLSTAAPKLGSPNAPA